MRKVVIPIFLVFIGCGDLKQATTPAETADKPSSRVALPDKPSSRVALPDKPSSRVALMLRRESDLPECEKKTEGQLVYLLDEALFRVCKSAAWSPIDLSGKQGARGERGEKGELGESGPIGLPGVEGMRGVAGTSCTVTQVAGGARIDCGTQSAFVASQGQVIAFPSGVAAPAPSVTLPTGVPGWKDANNVVLGLYTYGKIEFGDGVWVDVNPQSGVWTGTANTFYFLDENCSSERLLAGNNQYSARDVDGKLYVISRVVPIANNVLYKSRQGSDGICQNFVGQTNLGVAVEYSVPAALLNAVAPFTPFQN